jgi:hypothetical protein
MSESLPKFIMFMWIVYFQASTCMSHEFLAGLLYGQDKCTGRLQAFPPVFVVFMGNCQDIPFSSRQPTTGVRALPPHGQNDSPTNEMLAKNHYLNIMRLLVVFLPNGNITMQNITHKFEFRLLIQQCYLYKWIDY